MYSFFKKPAIFAAVVVLPVPCNPDSIAMAYALKLNGNVQPLTSLLDPDIFLNVFILEQNKSYDYEIPRIFLESPSYALLRFGLLDSVC